MTFLPDIKQAGNYTVTVYTPGCKQDNTCGQRGQANITGIFTATGAAKPVQATIFQTNDFDKYDQIYNGPVDASDGFRPSIILSPLDSQNSSISLTALRVRFQLEDPSSIGLNGLYEYDPSNVTANTDFKRSKIDSIGVALDQGADVRSVVPLNGAVWVAGNFTSQNASNILGIAPTNDTIILPAGGLNGGINVLTPYSVLLFAGGSFNDTNATHTPGLTNVAQYDTNQKTWSALGNGVNGPVTSIVELSMNITENVPEECITVNGPFTQVLATDGHPAFTVDGFAIWVPERNAWLSNLGLPTEAIGGQLTMSVNVTGSMPLLSGTIASFGISLSDSAELTASSGVPALAPSGLKIQQGAGNTGLQKRAANAHTANATGVVTGLIDTTGGRNLTIFGGHFDAQSSNGANISNLVIINDANNQSTGLPSSVDSNSTFVSLSTNGNYLYAGGVVTGDANGTPINGLVVWDMASSTFNSSSPPALGGGTVSVNAIATRPNTEELYVGGVFDFAGNLGCPTVCFFTGGQWSRPGTDLNGGNVTGMLWQGNNNLLAVGSGLTVGTQQSSVAAYDAAGQSWSIPNGASNIPGPISALSPASSDGSSYWVAGQDPHANPFLMLYSNNNFQPAPALGAQSYIRGLSVLSLTQQHASNNFIDPSLTLLVTGNLVLPDFGNCSGVLFDGNNYTAFLLSNEGDGPGSVGQVVAEQPQSFNTSVSHLALGYVVLIALAIALAIIFLLMALGLLIERRRRRAEGYRPAPQNYFEKTANMNRIPPERLFGNLNAPNAPRV